MGQPEINLGLIPGFGGTQRLLRLAGRAATLELCLTGAPIDQEINSRIPPASPEELAAYYEKVKGEYAPPDKAKFTTIYVFKSTLEAGAQETRKNWGWGPKGKRVDEEAKKVALEIKNALSQGQDAEAIVQHYRTLDKDKTPWIDQPVLQELPKGTFYLTSNFDEILFNLKDGEAGVFELPERYMVFRMIAKTPGTVPPLKEIEPAVSARLHQETLLKNYKEYIANLQKEAKITVKREYMKKIIYPGPPPGWISGTR